MNLANKVTKRREELGWTQEELAKKMGYSSRTSINKIENGRPCSQKIIFRLAEALDVPVAYLMDWESDSDQKEKPTDEFDGLSPERKALLEFARNVPEDKLALLMRTMKAILGDE